MTCRQCMDDMSSARVCRYHLPGCMDVVCQGVWMSSARVYGCRLQGCMDVVCHGVWMSSARVYECHLPGCMDVICQDVWMSSARVHEIHADNVLMLFAVKSCKISYSYVVHKSSTRHPLRDLVRLYPRCTFHLKSRQLC